MIACYCPVEIDSYTNPCLLQGDGVAHVRVYRSGSDFLYYFLINTTMAADRVIVPVGRVVAI